ncbi:hypothetical protein HMPREF9086_2906 [Enterobacter hormaechei ATCC 49162]|nr:hypothetical protein HMPREF9086_2906 [Enterobacter hormaechei ATCC 49162]
MGFSLFKGRHSSKTDALPSPSRRPQTIKNLPKQVFFIRTSHPVGRL